MAKKRVASKAATQGEGGDLVAMLKRAGAADLPRLDEEITALDEQIEQLKNERSALVHAKKLIGIRLHGSPIGGKRNPKLAAERRETIYELLSKLGPLHAGAIAEQTGIPKGSLTGLLKHEWFEREIDGWTIAKTRKGQ